MFSCYAGLAFVDVLALEESDFESENDKVWCYVYRAKSDGLCAIPLLPQAAAILRKYVLEARSAGRAKTFRKITNQQVNDSLKAIQEACEIPIYLTFHITRHTFAKTIALKNGVPLETVQMLHAQLVRMTESLAFELRSQNRLTGCVTLKLRYSDFETHTVQRILPYTNADHVLLKIVKELFAKLYERRLLVRLLGVRFTHLISGTYQISLFEDSQENIKLYQAIDSIRKAVWGR